MKLFAYIEDQLQNDDKTGKDVSAYFEDLEVLKRAYKRLLSQRKRALRYQKTAGGKASNKRAVRRYLEKKKTIEAKE
jgi:hypothetical protein